MGSARCATRPASCSLFCGPVVRPWRSPSARRLGSRSIWLFGARCGPWSAHRWKGPDGRHRSRSGSAHGLSLSRSFLASSSPP
eukprot:9363037-Alexandrium_andersonii.AAC.1